MRTSIPDNRHQSRLTSSSSSFLGDLFLLHPLMVMSSTPDRILVILPFSRSFSTFSLKTSPSAHRPFCFLIDTFLNMPGSGNSKKSKAFDWTDTAVFSFVHIKKVPQHLLFNKVLLGPDDGPWSADPYPGDGLCRSQAVMFHHVATNQSAGSPKASWNKKRNRLKSNQAILPPQTGGSFQESDLCSGRQWLLQHSRICWGTSWRWSRLECSHRQRTGRDVRTRSQWNVWRRTSSY